MEKKNRKPQGKKLTNSQKINRLSFFLKRIFPASLIGFLIAGSVGIILMYRHAAIRLERLDQEVVELRSAMNTDSVRQYKIQKIMKLAQAKNPNLTSMDAYEIANTIYEMEIRYANLDIDLICAVITHESANTWKPDVVSPAGAMGLMQIMPITGVFLADYERITWTTPQEILFNPVYNIRLGCRYLSALIDQYGLDGALAAYNAGERHAATWIAKGKNAGDLWNETRKYIPAVLGLYESFSKLSL